MTQRSHLNQSSQGRHIARRVMAERGLDTANLRLLEAMTKRAGACLPHLHMQGAVSRRLGPGQFVL
jgi:hypothetical protein